MKSINVVSLAAVAIVYVMSQSCWLVSGQERSLAQVEKIKNEVEKWFQKDQHYGQSFTNTPVSGVSDAQKQREENHWPRDLTRVLEVVTGVSQTSAIDMKEVARIARGLKKNDLVVQKEFLRNIRRHLFSLFLYRYRKDDLRTFERSRAALCGHLRSTTPFHFQRAIVDLTIITSEENVHSEHFIENLVTSNATFGPLYSAAMFCKLIDAVPLHFNGKNKEFSIEMPENIGELIGELPYPGI